MPRAHRIAPLLALVVFPSLAGATPSAPVYRPDADIWTFAKPVPPAAPTATAETPGDGTRAWSFTPNVRLHPVETGQHLWPDIAVAENGTIGAAWMDEHAAGGFHIFYVSSTDGGATWSAPERVDDRAVGAYSKFVSLAFTPTGTAVAVWEDDRTGGMNVYFSKRDGQPGAPWRAGRQVNTTGGAPTVYDFMNASLTILDEDRYFVAWTDWRDGAFYQVYLRGTRDGGATWGAETRVSDGLGYQPVAGDPCLIVDPNATTPGAEVLYCVTNDWRGYAPGGRYPNVFYYRSVDGGATWTTGVMVNDIEQGYQQTSSHALVKLDDGALAAGWLNNPTGGQAHYCVSRSVDGGAHWGARVQVDETGNGTGTWSSIATDGAYLYAAFDLYTTSWDAYFRASPNGGASWPDASARMDDDATAAAAQNTVIAAPRTAVVPGGRALEVYAAWQDNRQPSYDWKIYAAKGTLAGQGAPDGAAPVRALALRAYPNPSRTGGGVMLARGAAGEVGIFDATGRAVRVLALASSGAVWDGRDALGRPVPAGCYRLRALGAGRADPGVTLIRLR
jgi:hypothetical protein